MPAFTMIAHLGLLFLVFASVKTIENNKLGNHEPFEDMLLPFWRIHRDALRRLNKRAVESPADVKPENTINTQKGDDIVQQVNSSPVQEVPDKSKQDVTYQSEGGDVKPIPVATTKTVEADKKEVSTTKPVPIKGNETVTTTTEVNVKNTTANTTKSTTETANVLPLNNPGVVKRGLIVFGGFTLLAVAYLIFYRRKGKNYDSNNTHINNDTNQFRYGVLQSDEGRDNLELSRIPLTMESDEDDEEDLEIFDLEQRKKSLSYVNLQTNDEDIVFESGKDESKNNLLLDIEDGPSDMINWSSSGNKSIL